MALAPNIIKPERGAPSLSQAPCSRELGKSSCELSTLSRCLRLPNSFRNTLPMRTTRWFLTRVREPLAIFLLNGRDARILQQLCLHHGSMPARETGTHSSPTPLLINEFQASGGQVGIIVL